MDESHDFEFIRDGQKMRSSNSLNISCVNGQEYVYTYPNEEIREKAYHKLVMNMEHNIIFNHWKENNNTKEASPYDDYQLARMHY